MNPEIVCMGEPMLELNQTDPKEKRYLQGFGGDTSNCAIAAARQGGKVGYLTALGQDGFGDAFIELWRREGVDSSRVLRDPDAHTAVYFVTHGRSGHEFSYLRAGSAASRMKPEDVPADYIAAARALHVSGISQAISATACDAVFAAIAAAKSGGALVSYDTNLRKRLWPMPRARAIAEATAALADIVKASIEDAEALTGLSDVDAILDHYLAHEPKAVVVTLGDGGSAVATAERRQRLARHDVELVDATGAGDTFDGAFLVEYLRTGDVFASARWANAAAALAVTGFGAVAPMPDRDAVARLLARAEG